MKEENALATLADKYALRALFHHQVEYIIIPIMRAYWKAKWRNNGEKGDK